MKSTWYSPAWKDPHVCSRWLNCRITLWPADWEGKWRRTVDWHVGSPWPPAGVTTTPPGHRSCALSSSIHWAKRTGDPSQKAWWPSEVQDPVWQSNKCRRRRRIRRSASMPVPFARWSPTGLDSLAIAKPLQLPGYMEGPLRRAMYRSLFQWQRPRRRTIGT